MSDRMPDLWEFSIDVGGTFTDCIARRPDGQLVRHKTLSSGVVIGVVESVADACGFSDCERRQDPQSFWQHWTVRFIRDGTEIGSAEVADFDSAAGAFRLCQSHADKVRPGDRYELSCGQEAPLIAIRYLLGIGLQESISLASVRLGTTRGTNALLTRSGARTALVTTQGFGDVLRIGNQSRPSLFDLDIVLPELLYESVVEIDERMAADGRPLREFDESHIALELEKLKHAGIESLAICLMNAYVNPIHEQRVARLAREYSFKNISVSHEVSPLIKLLSRGDTTTADAYLNPILRDYFRAIKRSVGNRGFRLMTSAGNLVDHDSFSGKDSILSGPAGGVVGFAAAATRCGIDRAIGFDMGGTSTDVARFDGSFEREYETQKAGIRIVTPMMAIHTVAAGGGSICSFDGVKLTVGPASAGAQPGPASYGQGGPLTVTDVNLFLGKIDVQHFPFPLDLQSVSVRLNELSDQIADVTSRRMTPLQLANGFVQITNANMAQAIRAISISKGHDVRDYALVAFGGAGAQHACGVADILEIKRILVHPDAGILSAVGISHAQVARHVSSGVYETLDRLGSDFVENEFVKLEQSAMFEVMAEGIDKKNIEARRSADLRFAGTEAPISVPLIDGQMEASFHSAHELRYGWTDTERPIELVSLRVEAVGRGDGESLGQSSTVDGQKAKPSGVAKITFGETKHATNTFVRKELRPGDRLAGPALVHEDHATTVVDPNWSAMVLSGGELLLTRDEEAIPSPVGGSESTTSADPIRLEIFNRHFEAIAEQMGITLQNTSSSTNVKERLDFSCAIFTAAGDLVVNAPHIPVHLGAMGQTVRAILEDHSNIRSGDVFVTNDPYRGGSHLPDVTVVTPVFDHSDSNGSATSPKLLFFTASRAHHAEIGGITPGSMPPFSTNLAEEGVLIRSQKLIEHGEPRFDEIEKLLSEATYPSRDVKTNMADLAAQVAANRQGARDLLQLATSYSWPVVAAFMDHIQAAAEQKTRQALARLPNGTYQFEDQLDCGSTIRVQIEIIDGSAQIDFRGTSSVLSSNLNANRAIVTAAVLYVLRTMIGEPIPLNQGVLAPVEIIVPESMLNPPGSSDPEKCPAVVGGNVETSQRIVDVLIGALGLAAASQGTMNNVLFGDDSFGYYETICGGAGATANADGADAVHTHMTNTRITDPEILERRYPVRINDFSIREHSGGLGQHRGGNGVTRELEFLTPLDVSLLTQRRSGRPPYGMQGGEPGAFGRNRLVRATGESVELAGRAQFVVEAGDRLVVETPGGGGYGQQ